jgi:hypothetical protein
MAPACRLSQDTCTKKQHCRWLKAMVTTSSSSSDGYSEPHLQADPVCSLQNPQLLTPLLRHPSFCQDQQVLAQLLQTSKGMQTAVMQLLPRHLPVVLSTSDVPKASGLVQWLHKHAGLLQSLDVQLVSSFQRSGTSAWDSSAFPATLASALQQAAAAKMLQLQSFALSGSLANSSILQPLSAAQLTADS